MSNTSKAMSVVFFDICEYSNMDLAEQIRCIVSIEGGIKLCVTNLDQHAIVEGGDSFALNFDNLQQAVEFAVDISKYLSKLQCRIRTGIYTGEAIVRPTINNVKNIYGVAIDYAARLASCCEPNQILVAAHSIDDIAPRGSSVREYISGHGTYRVKHDIAIDVYNLYSQTEEFGIPELPLKRKIKDSSFLIVVGDRREAFPKTVGDIFYAAPSIDDLCHVFKFDWPDDVLMRGDKIMCWAIGKDNSVVMERNLFILGSPKVNIAAHMINHNSIFRFKMDNLYDLEIGKIYRRFTDSPPGDDKFKGWYTENQQWLDAKYPDVLSPSFIDDPLCPEKSCIKSETETYGLISFAPHPFSDDPKKYSIYVAGIDLCATLTITRNFFDLDFSNHPLGGVIRVNKERSRKRPWYDDPHYGQLSIQNGTYWATPSYDVAILKNQVENDRKNLINRLTEEEMKLSMSKIQTFLRKK